MVWRSAHKMSGGAPGIIPWRQRRKRGWAEEVGVRCSPSRDFSEPHGEFWGRSGPAFFRSGEEWGGEDRGGALLGGEEQGGLLYSANCPWKRAVTLGEAAVFSSVEDSS